MEGGKSLLYHQPFVPALCEIQPNIVAGARKSESIIRVNTLFKCNDEAALYIICRRRTYLRFCPVFLLLQKKNEELDLMCWQYQFQLDLDSMYVVSITISRIITRW